MQILLNYRKNRVFREVGLPYFIVAKKVGILKCVFFWKIYLFLYLREQKILKTIKNNKYFKRYKSQNPSKYGKKRIYKNNKEENVKWKSEQDLKGSYFIAKKNKRRQRMDTPITRAEHEEFRRRMEDEHKRMNHRLGDLEETVRQIGELTASVQSLAQSVEQMAQSQSRQETRLEELESRDGEMWRKVVGYVLTAVISVTVGFIFSQIGM